MEIITFKAEHESTSQRMKEVEELKSWHLKELNLSVHNVVKLISAFHTLRNLIFG